MEALKKISVNLSGTQLEFDNSGNPNVGYNLVEWVWMESGLDFKEIGSFNEKLEINKSLITWYTENSEVMSALKI